MPALCPVLYLTLNSVHNAREVKKTETDLNEANDRTETRRDADSPPASAINWLETQTSHYQCCHHTTSYSCIRASVQVRHQSDPSPMKPPSCVKVIALRSVQLLQQLTDFHKTRYEKWQLLWWLWTEIVDRLAAVCSDSNGILLTAVCSDSNGILLTAFQECR
jgi:hypothetical protein